MEYTTKELQERLKLTQAIVRNLEIIEAGAFHNDDQLNEWVEKTHTLALNLHRIEDNPWSQDELDEWVEKTSTIVRNQEALEDDKKGHGTQ